MATKLNLGDLNMLSVSRQMAIALAASALVPNGRPAFAQSPTPYSPPIKCDAPPNFILESCLFPHAGYSYAGFYVPYAILAAAANDGDFNTEGERLDEKTMPGILKDGLARKKDSKDKES
jgi:hypothetical protein